MSRPPRKSGRGLLHHCKADQMFDRFLPKKKGPLNFEITLDLLFYLVLFFPLKNNRNSRVTNSIGNKAFKIKEENRMISQHRKRRKGRSVSASRRALACALCARASDDIINCKRDSNKWHYIFSGRHTHTCKYI